MKKHILVLLVLFGAFLSAKAQDEAQPRISVGAGFGAAIGGTTSNYPISTQLNVRFELPLSDSQLSLVAATGINFFVSPDGYNYSSNSAYGSTSSGSIASFLPVQIGARYYINKLFVEGDAGASLNLGTAGDNFVTYKIKQVAPLITPSIGYGFRFGSEQKHGLDLSLGYDARLDGQSSYNSFSQIFFKVAYSLGL